MYKISVIMPVYNAEKSLHKSISSVINQTIGFEDIELILVDDNSSDGSRNIMEDYASRYPNVKNIFLKDNEVSGFIDLGAAGIGDKWRDIALCYRSLKHNVDGTWGSKIYPDVNPDLLLEELGIEPNNEKIRYYILLDELF